jgi:hypothetical protein
MAARFFPWRSPVVANAPQTLQYHILHNILHGDSDFKAGVSAASEWAGAQLPGWALAPLQAVQGRNSGPTASDPSPPRRARGGAAQDRTVRAQLRGSEQDRKHGEKGATGRRRAHGGAAPPRVGSGASAGERADRIRASAPRAGGGLGRFATGKVKSREPEREKGGFRRYRGAMREEVEGKGGDGTTGARCVVSGSSIATGRCGCCGRAG